MDEAASSERMVIVGRVLAPRGIHGEVRVEVLSDSPSRFSAGGMLYLEESPIEIRRASIPRQGVVVLKLDGVSSQREAENLRGHFLTVPREDIPELPQGTYYHFQIIDLRVNTAEGEYLGVVSGILPTGSNDVYIVVNEGQELLVPALDEVIVRVDVESGTMTVKLPDGLRNTS